MKGWICLAVFAIFFLAAPVNAEWNQQTLLESDTYMQVFDVSDDGSKIVYIADTDGNDVTKWDWDVFLMDLNTGEITRITRNVDQEVQAGISGDGNVIVYGTWTHVGGRAGVKYYEVRGDEGWQTPRPLMRGSDELMLRWPVWILGRDAKINYDGRVVLVYESGSGIHYFYNRQLRSTLSYYHAECRGSHFVVLGDGEIAMGETTSNIQINTIFAGYRAYNELVSGLDVSSDGKVFFSLYSDEEGRKGTFLYDGRDTFKIHPKVLKDLKISGDGSKVFYLDRVDNSYQVGVMNSDGSGDSLVDVVERGERGCCSILSNNDGSKLFLRCVDDQPTYKLILYTPPESTLEYDRIRSIIPNIHSSWLANSGVFIPPATTIEFGSAEGTAGSEVQIPVSIRNAENIGAINLVLNYPTDVLEFEELLAGSLTQNSMIEHNVQGENISVGIVDTEGISGDGSLFYLKFRVIGEVKKVNVPVEGIEGKKGKTQSLTQALTERSANTILAILEAIVNDVDGNEVEVVTIDGNFNLISEEEARRGDVNGDGVVNSLDALLALQMSVGKLEPNMIADMNGDGKVLANDALEIMKIATENMVSSSAIQIAQQQLGKGGFKPGIHEIGK